MNLPPRFIMLVCFAISIVGGLILIWNI